MKKISVLGERVLDMHLLKRNAWNKKIDDTNEPNVNEYL